MRLRMEEGPHSQQSLNTHIHTHGKAPKERIYKGTTTLTHICNGFADGRDTFWMCVRMCSECVWECVLNVCENVFLPSLRMEETHSQQTLHSACMFVRLFVIVLCVFVCVACVCRCVCRIDTNSYTHKCTWTCTWIYIYMHACMHTRAHAHILSHTLTQNRSRDTRSEATGWFESGTEEIARLSCIKVLSIVPLYVKFSILQDIHA